MYIDERWKGWDLKSKKAEVYTPVISAHGKICVTTEIIIFGMFQYKPPIFV